MRIGAGPIIDQDADCFRHNDRPGGLGRQGRVFVRRAPVRALVRHLVEADAAERTQRRCAAGPFRVVRKPVVC